MKSPDLTGRIRAALYKLNSGDMAAARLLVGRLHHTDPEHPAINQLAATLALRDGDAGLALRLVQASLRVRPGHVPSLILAGRAAQATEQLAEARKAFKEATTRAPGVAEPAFLLCAMLIELAEAEPATLVDRLAARFPDHAPEWLEFGAALDKKGHKTAALAALNQAATADPRLVRAHVGRALLLRQQGSLREAEAALLRAVTLAPELATAWFTLGLTRQDMGNEVGAAEAFGTALAQRPDFAEAAVNLGICLQRTGQMNMAMRSYAHAVALRHDTLGRVAQAMTAASTGRLFLNPVALTRALLPQGAPAVPESVGGTLPAC